MERFCLDTDFLVDFLRGKDYARDFVNYAESKAVLATTFVNIFELYFGAFKTRSQLKSVKAVDELMSRLTILNLSLASVRLAGNVQAKLAEKGNLIGFRDLLIGTVAVVNTMSVKTNNVKDFSRIEGLKLA